MYIKMTISRDFFSLRFYNLKMFYLVFDFASYTRNFIKRLSLLNTALNNEVTMI
jgi:hypothetical protein